MKTQNKSSSFLGGRKKFRPGGSRANNSRGGGGGLKKVSKTRKEIRKDQRKNKKAEKHKFLLAKVGKLPEVSVNVKNKKKKKRKKSQQSGAGNYPDPAKGKHLTKRESDSALQMCDNELKDLKRDMEEVRKKRLLEDNVDEDKYISQLQKKLKLNKKAIIPASFRTDGLDYLLEVCETKKPKNKGKMLKPDYDAEDSDSDEFNDSESDLSDGFGHGKEDLDSDSQSDSDEGPLEISKNLKPPVKNSRQLDDNPIDSDSDNDFSGSDELNEEGEGDLSESGNSEMDQNSDSDDGDCNDDVAEDDDKKTKLKNKKEKAKQDDELWEDIYGRLRAKDGSVVDPKSLEKEAPKTVSAAVNVGKYVPPMRRGNESQREKISKSLKGLLNRLSESNIHSISQNIEAMYMSNSRNEMNESLLELIYAGLVKTTTMSERIVLEHVMLITVLHANVGTEVGAYFIQNFVQDFRTKYDLTENLEESKELDNLVLLISSIYHFKIVDCCLIYDLLNFLANTFTPKDVELILTFLRCCGFRLRKDDPASLKALILLLQQKAGELKSGQSNSRVKFMLEILIAIRNNNMTKIPNYDPSFGEHLLKNLKAHLHKGTYVTEMKISMKDLLSAETKGRWWIVGSAWSNTEDKMKESSSKNIEPGPQQAEAKKIKENLLAKAKAQGMNTDTRRDIFCILMTAEDYLDAFEKLCHLGLKNQQEREIIHVLVYCCLQEKKFNPYYALVASKFCSMDRKYMLTLQYNLWDRLKDLKNQTGQQLINLGRIIVHLINGRSLSLSMLKVIEFADMDKIKLKFLKNVLSGILLQTDQDNLQQIFLHAALSEKLNIFRQSLNLFMGHFMTSPSVVTSDGQTVGMKLNPKDLEVLKSRIKIAETAMSLGKSRVQL